MPSTVHSHESRPEALKGREDRLGEPDAAAVRHPGEPRGAAARLHPQLRAASQGQSLSGPLSSPARPYPFSSWPNTVSALNPRAPLEALLCASSLDTPRKPAQLLAGPCVPRWTGQDSVDLGIQLLQFPAPLGIPLDLTLEPQFPLLWKVQSCCEDRDTEH